MQIFYEKFSKKCIIEREKKLKTWQNFKKIIYLSETTKTVIFID